MQVKMTAKLNDRVSKIGAKRTLGGGGGARFCRGCHKKFWWISDV